MNPRTSLPKRSLRMVALAAGVAFLLSCLPSLGAGDPYLGSLERQVRLEWWRAARFGMFIHWGPVSLKGTEIGWSRGQQVPLEEYDKLYLQFNPTNFNADEWMRVARDAGMRYVVFTTKHHDGFCMWDTRQTDFNIMRSPFGRDVVKELAAACRSLDLGFGTYHSVCDWHHPDFPLTSPGGKVRREVSNLDRYEEYIRKQVAELLTGYGPLAVLWFDVPQEFGARRGQALIDFARTLQPDLLVNNRSGAPGDYDTPEQRVGKYQDDRPWETCMTIARQWAWKPRDEMKSLQQCLQTLVLCAGGDGNLLFNVGPMPDGRIEPAQVDRLREMGAWLGRYGESVYETRGGPWKPTRAVASTRRGNAVYVHIFRWDGDTVVLPNLPRQLRAARVLTGGTATVSYTADSLTLDVPAAHRQPIDTILRLEFDADVMGIPAIETRSLPRTSASNVYQKRANFGPAEAFDGDRETRWATDEGTRQAWITADFGKEMAVSRILVEEALGRRVERFALEYKAGDGWKTVFEGTTLGAGFKREFPTITAREFRLNILEATGGPTLAEIHLE